MKIVIISPSPPLRGGIATHTACLYNELSKNHSVLIINYKKLYPNFLFPGKTQYNSDSSKLNIPSKKIINSIKPSSWKRACDEIGSFSPDLVLFRFWNPFFSICLSSIAKNISKSIKKIALCDNIVPHENYFIDKWMTKYFFNKVDGFIVQSSIVEKELLEFNPKARYTKLFHPVYDYLQPPIDKDYAKRELRIDKRYVALFFGLIRDYKGFDIFIESAKILKEKKIDIKFLAAGECYSKKTKYLRLIEKYNLEDIVIWIDEYIQDDDINKYFSASDFIVLPYKTASQSGIISLAYHYNTPVITSDLEGLRDYIDIDKTGFICTKNNPVVFSENIIKLMNDNIINKMSEYIKIHKRKFSWKEFCDGIHTFSNQL